MIRKCDAALLIWWAFLAVLCLSAYAVLSQADTLVLSGNSSGEGRHVMEIVLPGNFSASDGPLLLAYHGYNVSRDGRVWLKGEAWNVTGAM